MTACVTCSAEMYDDDVTEFARCGQDVCAECADAHDCHSEEATEAERAAARAELRRYQ